MSKKKTTKKVTKKTNKKNTNKVNVNLDDDSIYLEDTDLKDIESCNYVNIIADKDCVISQLKKSKSETELELLESKILLKRIEIQKNSIEVLDKVKLKKLKKEQAKETTDRIAKKYSIKDERWGIDPISGKIITGE